ncbi:MAG: hypothetical protein K1X56_08600 [Flavobacteriales bacterium]|nr:hypothetical protein [Flavobacteriales bacterium]
MNEAHFHLLVNHLPIMGSLFGLIVLALGFALRSSVVRRVGLFLLILGGLTAMPANFSGEGAEEVVESLPGADHKLIHEHEESAEVALIVSVIVALISMVGLFAEWKGKKWAIYVSTTVLLLSAGNFYLLRKVGTTGGEIRHSEIRKDFVASPEHEHEEEHEHEDGEHDDD